MVTTLIVIVHLLKLKENDVFFTVILNTLCNMLDTV